MLKDFAIPSEELIPPQGARADRAWSDLIDYWSVDFDYSDDIFHNQWQAYRTREEPALAHAERLARVPAARAPTRSS